jgi:hypothetical protein
VVKNLPCKGKALSSLPCTKEIEKIGIKFEKRKKEGKGGEKRRGEGRGGEERRGEGKGRKGEARRGVRTRIHYLILRSFQTHG